jgi:Secretion system C-terminal sorting domain
MKWTILFLLSAVFSLYSQDWDADTIKVDPRATYLRTNNDGAPAAVPFALESAALSPGNWVLLQRLGDFDNGPNGDTYVNLSGVFSRNDTLLANTVQQRVPGAVDAGVDFVSSNTYYSSLPTDIAEDFFIDSIYIQIPDSARFLFLSVSDSWFQDNSDPDGDFALRIVRSNPPLPTLIHSIPDTAIKEDSGPVILFADVRSFFSAPKGYDSLAFSVMSDLPQVDVFIDSFELHIQADSNFFGSAAVQLTAETSYGTFNTDTFFVQILPVNDAPFISGLADTIFTTGDSVVSLSMQEYSFDVDTPDSLLTWTFHVSDSSMMYTFDSLNALLQLNVTANWDNQSLICTLTDDSLAIASDTIFFSYNPATRLANEPANVIKRNYLKQNFPNPFNPKTVISYQLSMNSDVNLSIYNQLGQKVATFINKNQTAGKYNIQWDASSFSSGIYYYKIRTSAGFVQSRKLMLLK